MADPWLELTVDRDLTHKESVWLDVARARIQAEIEQQFEQQLINLLAYGTSHPQARLNGSAYAC